MLRKQPACTGPGCACVRSGAARACLTPAIRYAINDVMRAQEWAVYTHHSSAQPAAAADDDSDSDHSPKGYMSPTKRSPSRCVDLRACPCRPPAAACVLRAASFTARLTCAPAAGSCCHARALRAKAARYRPCGPTECRRLAMAGSLASFRGVYSTMQCGGEQQALKHTNTQTI
jgi:hypothetical protein